MRDQKQLLLEVVHKIGIDFQPLYTLPGLNYSNKLLQALNTDSIGSNNQQNPSSQANFTPSELRSCAREQIEIESKNGVTIHNIAVSLTESSDNKEFCRKKLNELYATWHMEICKAFKSRLNSLQYETELSGANIYMSLTLFKPEQYADMTLDYLKEFTQKYKNGSIGLRSYTLLGERIYLRHEWELKKADGIIEKTKKIYDKYCDEITLNRSPSYYRQKWQHLELTDCDFRLRKQYDKWSRIRAIQVGKFLFELIKENIKIDENLFEENSKGSSCKPIMSSYEANRQTEYGNRINPVLLR